MASLKLEKVNARKRGFLNERMHSLKEMQSLTDHSMMTKDKET